MTGSPLIHSQKHRVNIILCFLLLIIVLIIMLIKEDSKYLALQLSISIPTMLCPIMLPLAKFLYAPDFH